MKSLVLVAILAQMPTAYAVPRNIPNLFTCEGTDTSLTLSTSGFDAQPSLQILRRGLSPLNFRGEQINFDETQLGQSARIMETVVFDAYIVTSELIIPKVNVDGFEEVKNVQTVLLTTTKRTSIAGPDLVEGAVTEHKATNLNCTVQFVNF